MDESSSVDLEVLSSARVGRVLAGKWCLVDMLGAGSAGAVYRAVGPGDQFVAVKMLHPELAVEKAVRARFVHEAYLANKIESPGVVRVIEDGVDEDGVPFLVMELLEGETLEARLSRKGGRLPVFEVLWATDRTLRVLEAAHKKGVVHRDIKPENLFLTSDRSLKVLDFGIARIADSVERTRAGTVLGTLAFMAPEQARGDVAAVGVRSDLWSVGATMFTLLSGRLVRDDADVGRLLLEAGQSKVPSLREAAPELPSDLTELVDYALSLETAARWPNAKTMRRAVRMVYAKMKQASARPARDEDEDDGEVSAPSFGLIATRTIEPPPLSIAYSTERRIALGVVPPEQPAARDSAPHAPTSTLHSREDSSPADPPPPKKHP
ncbi:MAG: serine/threonine-protein kinase [Polyangiaceae bacterium]|jgi:eukaryotic-like serine/threonine-protein kinase